MILEEKVKDLVVVGEDNSKKAKISGDKLAKLQYLLTKGLYKDPITAVIAEWTNNGIDAVVQAGKNPIENPVIVKINKDAKGQYVFSVEDKGTGLDDRDFEDVCMNYLESTKEEDNDTIGHFGIGMKSFLSLERSATFTCRKNGVERKYLVYEGAEFVNYDLIYQKETTEENGVLAELMINGWSEMTTFVTKARAKLAYYDTAVLVIDNRVVSNEIHRNELFQWSTLNTNNAMHLCLKDVYYTIDYEALGIQPIQLGVAIRLQLGDGLTPTPSRESYITNEKTKELLLRKIKEIADWFVSKYNETVKEFPTFLDAYDYLGNTAYQVRLKDNSAIFIINPIVSYSKHKPLSPKVVGIKVRNPNDYKIHRHNLLLEYTAVGYMNSSGIMKSKEGRIGKSKEYHIFDEKGKVVEVGMNFKGNIKDFLKEKYGKGVMYIRRNSFKWKIGKVSEKTPTGQIKIETDTYRHILNLTTKPKNVWRQNIDEWNFVISTIVSTFVNEKGVEDTKEYQDWLEKKREEQKEKRRLNYTGSSKVGLNKQVGDVTMAYSYKRYSKFYFKKEVYRIEKLHTNKFVTVLLEEDEVEKAKTIMEGLEKNKFLLFAKVGKLERKKIPSHYQFINFQQFMSRDCKPFMRLASSVMFERALEELNVIKGYRDGVFRNFLKSLHKDEEVLTKYVDDNMTSLSVEAQTYITDLATEHKLFDLSLWDVYQRILEGIKKYDFINLLKEPSAYDADAEKKYTRLITQILLFRKKYYNDLPEGTKIVFEETV